MEFYLINAHIMFVWERKKRPGHIEKFKRKTMNEYHLIQKQQYAPKIELSSYLEATAWTKDWTRGRTLDLLGSPSLPGRSQATPEAAATQPSPEEVVRLCPRDGRRRQGLVRLILPFSRPRSASLGPLAPPPPPFFASRGHLHRRPGLPQLRRALPCSRSRPFGFGDRSAGPAAGDAEERGGGGDLANGRSFMPL